jgi:cytochrome P450
MSRGDRPFRQRPERLLFVVFLAIFARVQGKPDDWPFGHDGPVFGTPLSALSDYNIPRRADRHAIYAGEGIRWSDQLKRWLVTDAGLISRILRDPAFESHSYDISALEQHFRLDLRHLKEISRLFPLAFDGEPHRRLRKRFSGGIAGNTEAALKTLESELDARLDTLLVPGRRFCAMQDLLTPAVTASILALAGLGSHAFAGAETLPLLFDDTISLKRRIAINAAIGAFYDSLAEMPPEERYFRIAIVALGANTLLASLAQSLAVTLERNAGSRLGEIEWDADFCATGLPVIEKVAGKDRDLEGSQVRKGDRLRLFLDAGGFSGPDGPFYSDLYFAVGPHRCPGMNFSRRAWRLLAGRLGQFPVRLETHAMRLRDGDVVFKLPVQMELSVHA